MARATASSKRSLSQSRSRSRSRSAESAHRRSPSKSRSRSRSRSAAVRDKKTSTKDNNGDNMEIDGDVLQDKRRSPSATKDKSALVDASMSPSKVFSLRVDNLTRNVNADHLSEIFGKFGAVVSVNLARERMSKVPKGFAFVGFKSHSDAEKAQDHMHEGWLDGKKVHVRFATDDDYRRSRSVERNSYNKNGSQRNCNTSADGRRGRENVPRNKRSLSPRGRRGSLASPPRNNNRQRSPVPRRVSVQRRSPFRARSGRGARRAASPFRGRSRSPINGRRNNGRSRSRSRSRSPPAFRRRGGRGASPFRGGGRGGVRRALSPSPFRGRGRGRRSPSIDGRRRRSSRSRSLSSRSRSVSRSRSRSFSSRSSRSRSFSSRSRSRSPKRTRRRSFSDSRSRSFSSRSRSFSSRSRSPSRSRSASRSPSVRKFSSGRK